MSSIARSTVARDQKRTKVCDYSYVDPFLRIERFFKRRFALDPPGPDGRTKTFALFHRVSPYSVKAGVPDEWKDLIYNLPAVRKAVRAGEPVWWTEGEKDADSLIALGVTATTHWGGAGKTTDRQAEWLEDASQVVLLYDVDRDDARGGNAGAMDVIRRYEALRAVGVPRDRIFVGHAAVGKDVTDHLAAGLGLDELVWCRDLVALYEKASHTSAAGLRARGYRAGRDAR